MDRGKYTVNEVEERTSVPGSTLRQWERRYGFPKPDRSQSGYRLYSDNDIRDIETMKRHIADGIPASRAAELVKRRAAEAESTHPAGGLRDEFLDALLALDEGRADDVLSQAHALHPVDTVLLDVIGASLVQIGQRWHNGEIRTTTEHFASNYVQGRLRALLSLTSRNRNGSAVIVACAPLNQHELGALMLAILLRRSGFQVYFLGANTPLDDLLAMTHDLKPAAVMISVATDEALARLSEQRELLRDLPSRLIVGGRAVDADRAERLGASYLAGDLRANIRHFERLLDASLERA